MISCFNFGGTPWFILLSLRSDLWTICLLRRFSDLRGRWTLGSSLRGRGANGLLPKCISYTHTHAHTGTHRHIPSRGGGSRPPRPPSPLPSCAQHPRPSAPRTTMEVLESGEQSVLQWDRKLSELSEPGETEALMYHTVRTRWAGEGAAGEG